MTLRGILASAAATVLATIGVLVVSASPAAAAACTFDQAHIGYFISSVNTGFEVEGVQSHIITRPTDVFCTGQNNTNNFSVAWNMTVDTNNTGDYSQAGTRSDVTRVCPRAWAEQSLNGIFHDRYGGGGTGLCLPNGSSHLYQNVVVIVNGSYQMEATFDGGLIMETGYNPFSTWTSGEFQDQYYNEMVYKGTGIPGDTAAHSNQNSMGYQKFTDDLLIGTCNNATVKGSFDDANNDALPVKESVHSCSSVDMWATS